MHPLASTPPSATAEAVRRPRVLLIAEAANPEWVSVPLVGWSLARALSREVDAHLVTQVRNREAIVRAGLVEGRDFTAIDSEPVARPLYRLANLLTGGRGKGFSTITALETLSYYYFESVLWRRFAPALARGEYDLVHRITPLSPAVPSLIAKRCARLGVPFVLGPLNGGVPWPREFAALRKREREWLSRVRAAHRWLPGFHSSRQHASAILVASRSAMNEMPERYRAKCRQLQENAIDPSRFPMVERDVSPADRTVPERPLQAVFVGRLVPLKGVDMLLEAAAPLCRARALAIDILGDGPEMQRLVEIAAREKLADSVRFSGWVAHADVERHLRRAHVMVLPSIREFGGGVVLEAMASGVVPIVVDYGGPGELVTPESGFAVPMGDRASIVRGLTEVLEKLTHRPNLLAPMAERGLAEVRAHHTWPAKARKIAALYAEMLGAPLASTGAVRPAA